MSVTPLALSVTAVATTMQRATKFDSPMPTNVSCLIRDKCSLAYAE